MDCSCWWFSPLIFKYRYTVSPPYLKSLAKHTTVDAVATVSEVPQGLLRWLGGDIPREVAGIALAFCLCVFRLHHSRGRRGWSGGLL